VSLAVLSRLFDWRDALVVVRPQTLIRWHRAGWRLFWRFSIAARCLACTYPCRRFADTLTDACARLGADVVRYSFIARDFHPLLLVSDGLNL